MKIQEEKDFRVCFVTGEVMTEGYYCDQYGRYYSKEKYALEFVLSVGYKSIEEAYDDDFIYYTKWE